MVVGDFIKVKTAYGKVTDIEAQSFNQDEVEGFIKSVLIADTPIITIIDEDGDEREYKLHSKC